MCPRRQCCPQRVRFLFLLAERAVVTSIGFHPPDSRASLAPTRRSRSRRPIGRPSRLAGPPTPWPDERTFNDGGQFSRQRRLITNRDPAAMSLIWRFEVPVADASGEARWPAPRRSKPPSAHGSERRPARKPAQRRGSCRRRIRDCPLRPSPPSNAREGELAAALVTARRRTFM